MSALNITKNLNIKHSTNLYVRTLKLWYKRSVTWEDGDVEPIAVRVADQDVAGVRNIDAIRKIGEILAAYATQKVTLLAEYHHVVALEVAHVKLLSCNA